MVSEIKHPLVRKTVVVLLAPVVVTAYALIFLSDGAVEACGDLAAAWEGE